ncbi:MAG: hypothetical protein LBS42_05080 [Tannerella sp.]|jgi:hypothetical protein|nr:hypothetical protein [Tannerella sp.]
MKIHHYLLDNPITVIFFISAVLITGACTEQATVIKDPKATGFFRRTEGWIASDGAISAALTDGRTVWLMGDSHIDDYDPATQTVPWLFQVRNAALLQPANDWKPENTRTLVGNGPDIKSFFKSTPNDSLWIWPGNGIQLGDTLYVYCGELIKTGDGIWGFGGTGRDMFAKLKVADMTVSGYDVLPNFNGINFGAGFVRNEHSGYVYAYGYKLIYERIQTEVYVARFHADTPVSNWEYWNGKDWTPRVQEVAAISRGAHNPHVSKVGDRYLILTTELSVQCDMGKHIFWAVGDSPTGPFPEQEKLYAIDDTLQGHYPFFYTVAAHPQFINDDGLLVTYCINGYEPCLPANVDGRLNPDHYRPRAIRVPLNMLFGNPSDIHLSN